MPPAVPALRVLIIDDDEDDFDITRDLFIEGALHPEIQWERTYAAGLSALCRSDHDVCLLDYRLGAKTGLELLASSVASGCRVPVILLTGTGGHETDLEAMNAGAADYLVKGELTSTQLERAVRYACERQRYLAAIERGRAELLDVIEKLAACIMIRRDDRFIYANPAAAAAMGYSDPHALVGRSVLDWADGDDREIAAAWMHDKASTQRREFRVRRADDSVMLVETSAEATPITFGNEPAYLVSFRDITAARRNEQLLREHAQQMEALSLVDELTQLYNRRGFLALATQQLKAAARAHRPVAVLFVDLDGLKAINDDLGHEAGDAAIVATAGVLRATFRDADVVGRLGGDEFVVMVLDCDDLQIPIRRLLKEVETYNNNGGDRRAFRLSLSNGAARFDPNAPESVEELLQRADAAMYQQKQLRYESLRPARAPR